MKKKIQGDHLFLNVLRVDEISYTERIWIIDIQKDVYSSERYPQLKKDLRLTTLADNILRCEGRLKNAPISYDSRFPIFIPKGTFAKLLVNYYHELVHHNGLKETLNEIRTRYWIPKARYFIQQNIQKCRTCKRIEGKTYIYPDSPSLPVARLSESPPFTFTGLGYAGPVHVRNMYNSSTITYKAWICSTTRTVCLDLVPDCSAQACIGGLKRFFSRRGVPQSILSDNGSNFTAEETKLFAATLGVLWKFNPPALVGRGI